VAQVTPAPAAPLGAKPGLHCRQVEPVVEEKQLVIVFAVAHVVADARAAITDPAAQALQVPLPSGRHPVHAVIEVGAPEIVFLQRTQVRDAPVPLAIYGDAQVRGRMAEVHVAAPVPQAVQAPVARKYPELQTTHPVAVALTQAAQFEEAAQAVQVPGATIKNPEVQDAQAVMLGVVQIEQYWQPGTNGQAVTDAPVVPVVP